MTLPQTSCRKWSSRRSRIVAIVCIWIVSMVTCCCTAFAPLRQKRRPACQGSLVTRLRSTTAAQNGILGSVKNDLISQRQQKNLRVQREVVPMTMREALTTFWLGEYNGPRAVVVGILGMLAWRIVLNFQSIAALGVSDALAISAAVVYWWIQEHWMHKYLLHSNQKWHGQQVHEVHHLKPYHHVSIDPAYLMLGWLITVHFLLKVALPLSLALAASIGYAAAGLFYEWSHFIVHTKVRFPRGSYWQRMKDHHIRHHLVDSDFWLAFSITQVDDLFGTNPNVQDVQRQNKRSVAQSSPELSQVAAKELR